MKTLILLRHAKTERESRSGSDFDRVLMRPRGPHDARLALEAIIAHFGTPEVILCSTAARARETLTIDPPAALRDSEHHYRDRLYLASPGATLNVIAETQPEAKSILVIGHNPGLHELALDLADRELSDPNARERLKEKFPTAAFAALRFDTASWRLSHQRGELIAFQAPKQLRESA